MTKDPFQDRLAINLSHGFLPQDAMMLARKGMAFSTTEEMMDASSRVFPKVRYLLMPNKL